MHKSNLKVSIVDEEREVVRVIECLALNSKHPIVLYIGRRPVIFVEDNSDSRGRIHVNVDQSVCIYPAVSQLMDDGFKVTEPYDHCISDYYRIEIPEGKHKELKEAFYRNYPHKHFVHEYGINNYMLKNL